VIAYGTDHTDTAWCDQHALDRAACGCGPIGIQPYTDIQPEQITWLWRHRIAAGKLNSIEGDPGVSKSTLSLALASHITTGTPWPDGTPCPHGTVLLMTAEDGHGDTIRPRLDAAGADVSRVFQIHTVTRLSDNGAEEAPPTLADIDGIEAHIRTTGASLLIVDVLMAFLPRGVDSHRDHDVRVALRPLASLAERTRCAIVLIRHLNKGSGPALYRAGGSIGITGLIRCANLVARDPDDDAAVVFAPGKNNLAPTATASLRYRLVSEGEHPRIEWLGESSLRADDLTSHSSPEERGESAALSDFIRDYLTEQGGEAAARDVQRAVSAAFGPVAKSTMQRARNRAGVTTGQAGWHGGWVWRLTDPDTGSTQVHQVPGSRAVEPVEPVEPVRERRPADSAPIAPILCLSCGLPIEDDYLGDGCHAACQPITA
jgi:hypothetical protein